MHEECRLENLRGTDQFEALGVEVNDIKKGKGSP
jgi:hypothetical protein